MLKIGQAKLAGKIDKNLRITAADLHDKEADVAIQIREGVWISKQKQAIQKTDYCTNQLCLIYTHKIFNSLFFALRN
jgi:hypothetical protein